MASPKSEESPKSAAEVAAELYASFLAVPIPPSGRDILHFSAEQAFALTLALFYETLKDEGL